VVQSDDQEQERPDEPSQPAADSEDDDERQDAACNPAMMPAKECIGDVASVELANGKEIEARHEQPEPSGKRDGMQQHRYLVGAHPEDRMRQPREEQRVTQDQPTLMRLERLDGRQ
jgi:hypothetical protein